MPIRSVLRMGHPLLLKKAKLLQTFDTPALHDLVRDMRDTMQEREGVGLAAPQIGESIQLVIFGMEQSSRYPDAEPIPETILLNPIIEPLSDETAYDWEGCLSVPGMRGLVKRNTEIRYTGYDLYGKTIVREVSGFHARVVQHECDHLWGVLYPMRIKNLRHWGFQEEIMEYRRDEKTIKNKS